MENTVKLTQIEGISARQIFEAFKCLENQIETLKEQIKPPKVEERYLSRNQVSEILGVSLVTVHDWTGKGFLKAYRLGQKVFYKAAEIDAAMVEIKKGGRRYEK